MNSIQNTSQSENRTKTNLLRNLLIISIIVDVAALVAAVFSNGWEYLAPIGALLVFAIISMVFLLLGILLPAQILLPASLFVVITYIVAVPPGYGLHDINLMAYAAVITMAGLTLGQTGAFTFAALVILAVFGIGFAEINGLLVSPTSSLTEIVSPFAISIVVLAITFILRSLNTQLNENVQRLRVSEEELVESNKELLSFNAGLEKLIQARTAALDSANQRNEYRARQFEAIAQVSRAINQTQNLQDLLPQITLVIHQQFAYYHVGIFLLDANNEYAVLVASNSEGGQRMLARNHKLKIGQVGIVGNVASTGIPRIALDTGADAIYFNNPDLPETRSEMALPLFRSGKELIGLIDVQSIEPNAFGQEDIQILITLADQVSIAIANASLYEETQKSLLESEMLYRRDIQAGWLKFTRSEKLMGIRRFGIKSNLIYEPLELPGAAEVTRSGNVYFKKAEDNNGSTQMTIPMKLRGEIVGMLNVKTNNERVWSADEMDIVTAIIERAALSIENARLLNESQKLSIREQTISQMSTRIGAGIDVETILKTAVRELGNQIGGAQVTVEMGRENE